MGKVVVGRVFRLLNVGGDSDGPFGRSVPGVMDLRSRY